jgi:hypothetical protein
MTLFDVTVTYASGAKTFNSQPIDTESNTDDLLLPQSLSEQQLDDTIRSLRSNMSSIRRIVIEPIK